MFQGQKVGVRKSALKAFGGDLKELWDSPRLNAITCRKHRGILDPEVEEGNRHPTPNPRDITGYSRSKAGHFCAKDYRDYRPWRNNLPLRDICVLPEAPDVECPDFEADFEADRHRCYKYYLLEEELDEDELDLYEAEERDELLRHHYPEAYDSSLNKVLCTIDGRPVRAYEFEGECETEPQSGQAEPIETIRIGRLEFDLA